MRSQHGGSERGEIAGRSATDRLRLRPSKTWTRVETDPDSRRLAEVKPLINPVPRPTMWLGLSVLVAVIPGLLALRHWDLSPPGPWWGLRGLAVLEGYTLDQVALEGVGTPIEGWAYRQVAMHPPLYAWLEAAALAISGDRAPIATVVPSFLAGLFLVLLVYRLGVLWGGPPLGGVAAILTGLNRQLLNHMQFANPATLGLAFALAALLADGYAIQAASHGRRRAWLWTLASGIALGLSLLSVAFFGLLVPIILGLQRVLVGGEPLPPVLRSRWPLFRRIVWRARGALTTLAALVIGLALAAPWHYLMAQRHGLQFWRALVHPPFSGAGIPGGPLEKLLQLAPATLGLAVYGAFLAVRRLKNAERGSTDPRVVSSALALAWIAVTVVLPLMLPAGPRPVLLLFLLVPLNLLAARLMLDLALRRVGIQALLVLVPVSAVCLAWWACPPLRDASGALLRGQVSSAVMIALPLGLALLVAFRFFAQQTIRWAGVNDGRRRGLRGSFLGLVFLVTLAAGIHEVEYRHRETLDLLSLREAVLRRQSTQPFTRVTVLGLGSEWSPLASLLSPSVPFTAANFPTVAPGGRLRFVLRSALPGVSGTETARVEDLAMSGEGPQLVVLAGTGSRLTYSAQARLRLESIYPSRGGLLDAYATPIVHHDRPVGRRR